MEPGKVRQMLIEGRRHLHFVIGLYKLQIDGQRHFLHEHPTGATSWKDSHMLRLLRIKGVKCVTSDQCQYGLLTPDAQGNMVPAKKPTKWMSYEFIPSHVEEAVAKMLWYTCAPTSCGWSRYSSGGLLFGLDQRDPPRHA